MHLLIRLIINAIVFYLIAKYVQGFNHDLSGGTAIIAAIIFGLVNAIIRPILLLITLPINIVTLGLFTIIVNALMFWLTATFVSSLKGPGFGFVPALEGAIIMMIVSLILSHVFNAERRTA